MAVYLTLQEQLVVKHADQTTNVDITEKTMLGVIPLMGNGTIAALESVGSIKTKTMTRVNQATHGATVRENSSHILIEQLTMRNAVATAYTILKRATFGVISRVVVGITAVLLNVTNMRKIMTGAPVEKHGSLANVIFQL